MTQDYNAKLAQDLTDIGGKVKAGLLPLDARRQALDDATSRYALAQADHYASTPRAMPIALRNVALLDRAADAMLHEDLRWSHPDKMSIVDYPIMSDSQVERRRAKHSPNDDLEYDHSRRTGWRKSSDINDDGIPYGGRTPVFDTEVAAEAELSQFERLRLALDGAGLTHRQRQAIDLVYFDDLTQEAAARVMDVSKPNINAYLAVAFDKLREHMTK